MERAGVELAYEPVDWKPADSGRITDALYEGYALQSIRIPGSQGHPTRLVQSAAMASVAPPKPAYRPHLPANLVSDGFLSDAQLESVIYAGEAHSGYLAGSWTVDDTFDVVSAAADDAENAVRFRRGWFLGDGTGAGKGRQVAGILLDNWLKGRRRAVWISRSEEHTSELQSHLNLVCRLLLEKKKHIPELRFLMILHNSPLVCNYGRWQVSSFHVNRLTHAGHSKLAWPHQHRSPQYPLFRLR